MRFALILMSLMLSVCTIGPLPFHQQAGTVLQEPDLRAKVESSPRLPFEPTTLPIQRSNGQELGMVSWITVDPRSGHLWLLQRGANADPILEIDGSGRVLTSFGRGALQIPHAIRLDAAGHVWTVDAGSSQVIEWSVGGVPLRTLRLRAASGATQSTFDGATDVAFAPDGRILVSDGYANARVVEYAPDGSKLRDRGSPGEGPGQFHLPHSVVVDENGTVYVADRENGRIEEFDLNGRYKGEIGGLGRTYALALGPRGTLWASMQPMDEPAGSAGWLVQFDRATGRMLGYVPVNESGGLHTIAVDGEGQPLTAIGSTVVWFNRRVGETQPAR